MYFKDFAVFLQTTVHRTMQCIDITCYSLQVNAKDVNRFQMVSLKVYYAWFFLKKGPHLVASHQE